MTCPHCGAPPPAGFVTPAGQFSYRCMYCNQSSTQGSPASVAQAPPVTGPIFIVEHHHYEEDVPHYVPMPVPMPVMRVRTSSWLIWVVVVILISGGGGIWRWRRNSGSVGNQILTGAVMWNGSEPLVCGGNDDIAVSGVSATFTAGSAIQASGNCHVRCTDCVITAPTAVEAGGNAEVILMNGSVKGTTLLANASGNAHITITGNVTASGATKQSSNASISAPPAPAKLPSTPAPPPSASTPAAAKAKKPASKKH